MNRPKKLANRVVEQWEQNLLLKVMQRKIKCAKSTISAIQGTRKSQCKVPLAQKPSACLEVCEEWNFLDGEQEDQALAENLLSHFNKASKPKVLEHKSEENGVYSDGSYGDLTTNESQGEENINPQLGFHHHEQELPNEMDDFVALKARFHENLKDCNDDLLSQIWSSCKRDNTLFDDISGLNQPRRVGASSLHTADFDPSPIPITKMASLKQRRIPKILTPHPKKNMVRDPASVSKFMKKRETGWRE